MAKKEKVNGAVEYSLTPFTPANEVDASKFKRLTLPPIVKLREMPQDAVIDCVPVEVIPGSDAIPQPTLLVDLTGRNTQVRIPMQAALKNVLLDKKGNCQFIGKRVLIRKAGERVSTKYKDDNGDARKFNVYDVAVAK